MYVYKFMHMFRYVHIFVYAHFTCAYCVHLDCRNQLMEILALGLGCKPIVDSTNHCEILFETRLARRRGEIYIIQMHNVHLPRCVPMHPHWYIARLSQSNPGLFFAQIYTAWSQINETRDGCRKGNWQRKQKVQDFFWNECVWGCTCVYSS